jgi:hypothetical protein
MLMCLRYYIGRKILFSKRKISVRLFSMRDINLPKAATDTLKSSTSFNKVVLTLE